MCFSAEVDFAATAVITVPAVDALRHTEEPRELPIAVIPALFVAHSLMSGFAWLGFEGSVSTEIGDAASWLYVLVAFVVIPVLVPWAVWFLEEERWRRNVIAGIGFIGLLIGSTFLFRLLANGYEAIAHEDWISWKVRGHGSILLSAGYLTATCGAMLISGERWLVVYGVANAIAVVLIAWAARSGFASIWCFWAAITSAFIALYLRSRAELAHERIPQHHSR